MINVVSEAVIVSFRAVVVSKTPRDSLSSTTTLRTLVLRHAFSSCDRENHRKEKQMLISRNTRHLWRKVSSRKEATPYASRFVVPVLHPE